MNFRARRTAALSLGLLPLAAGAIMGGVIGDMRLAMQMTGASLLVLWPLAAVGVAYAWPATRRQPAYSGLRDLPSAVSREQNYPMADDRYESPRSPVALQLPLPRMRYTALPGTAQEQERALEMTQAVMARAKHGRQVRVR